MPKVIKDERVRTVEVWSDGVLVYCTLGDIRGFVEETLDFPDDAVVQVIEVNSSRKCFRGIRAISREEYVDRSSGN